MKYSDRVKDACASGINVRMDADVLRCHGVSCSCEQKTSADKSCSVMVRWKEPMGLGSETCRWSQTELAHIQVNTSRRSGPGRQRPLLGIGERPF